MGVAYGLYKPTAILSSSSLRGDVAICAEALSGPNVQPHIPLRVRIAVRLLQASKEQANAPCLVPRIRGLENLVYLLV